ncbi:MAG: aminotransferase class III-fold pyridoxal phosphate-dependent enzyme [Actinomycetota bacterium]|nr:aminotransferase class III-fold pyridoxal phosphate-dependent enzyme [Actinomycetota bacterium]
MSAQGGSAPPAFLHPFAKPTATEFMRIVSGEGAIVTDDHGRSYVDAMGSLWYCNVGHGRAEIADAVAQQLRKLAAFHTFEKFTNDPADQLCEELVAIAPVEGARVFLTSSGSEAVDSAIKIARLAHAVGGQPQRQVIVSRRPSYHGVTYGGLAATGLPLNQEHFGSMLPDVVQTPHDDLGAVEAVFAERGERIAAVIAEPVIGAGGVYPPVVGYLQGLRRLCDEHGAWLILDEVICAFGRLGSWWGAERFGVRPDLVTFAKAVTSGYVPLGGVVIGGPVRRVLESDPALVLRHGHTYSGHPTACAAGLAALAITRREGLLDRASKIGERLASGLRSLADDGLIAEARGDGAVWAAGLHPDTDAVQVRDRMLTTGVITRPIGTATLSFCPPLVISDDDVDRCVTSLETAITELRRDGARTDVG